MKTFESWFPIEETDTKEDVEIFRERFAATKLCLELGEYTSEDYDYLFIVHEMVVDNKTKGMQQLVQQEIIPIELPSMEVPINY